MAKSGVRSALAVAALFSGLMFSAPALAQDASWLANPADGNFGNPANWSPATVPGSVNLTGTATFGQSTGTNIDIVVANLGGLTLTAGASNYAFSLNGGVGILVFNGAGIVINGGSANFTNSGNLIDFMNSSSAGGASITNVGAGIPLSSGITLFDNTSTSGNAKITNNTGGLTQFVANSTGGSATITNNTGGQTQFTDTSTAGNATITNNNTGRTLFQSNATAGNATITNNTGGQTEFHDTSTAGSATITSTTAGSELLFANGSTAGNATIITGFSTVFQDNSTAGNARITNTGQLDFFDSTSAGSATIINNIDVNGSNGVTNFFGHSTGGNARLINVSGGLFDFSTSSGPLGNNQLSAGSIEGAGLFFLGSNQLTVGSNNLSTTVSGVISGNGPVSLVKVGSGTLALTANNVYTGRTLVNGGTLEVDGSIASSNMVLVGIAGTGGTLSGTGVVNRAGILSGGTLAPGNAANPFGTLTSMTNLTFVSGAFYLVQVGASASNTDVLGTASVANATVQVATAGGVQGDKTYDILHSTNIGGSRFAGVQSLSPGFAETLSYSATDVLLSLNAKLGAGSGLNVNQQNVATTLNNFFNNGGALPQGFVNLFNLSGAPLGNALTQLSGETAVGSQQTTFNAMSQFMGVITDPFMNRGGFGGSQPSSGYTDESLDYATSKKTDAFAMFTKAPTHPSPASGGGSGWGLEQRWSVWASGFGGSQSTSGNVALGSNNTTSNIAGTAVGADYLISPNTIAGFALAGGGTNFSVANGGSGRSDLFQIGAYVRHNSGPAYVSAALAYGWQDVTTNRTVTVASIDQLRAEFNANAWSGRLEGGYRFVSPVTGGVGITPYAAAQFVTFDLPAYAEQAIVGSNQFALGYGAHDATDVRTELGIRTDKSWAQSDGILTLRGRFAWAHDYDPDRAIGATFQSLPGASFVVNGAAQASDSALTTASIEKRWRNGWSAAATFEGEFSHLTQSYAGKGVVRYQW